MIQCFTDGACRGNGSKKAIGSIGVSLVINEKEIDSYSEYLGHTVDITGHTVDITGHTADIKKNKVRVTNNITEYLAFIKGLEMLKYWEHFDNEVIVNVDSKLVCEQINGRWKINNNILKILHQNAKDIMSLFNNITIKHVLRKYNKRADELANEAIDNYQVT